MHRSPAAGCGYPLTSEECSCVATVCYYPLTSDICICVGGRHGQHGHHGQHVPRPVEQEHKREQGVSPLHRLGLELPVVQLPSNKTATLMFVVS